MQNLWNAVAHILADDLEAPAGLLNRLRVASTAGGAPTIEINRAPSDVRTQPTPTALTGIAGILRVAPYNLRLGLYELSELNRLIHRQNIDQELKAYKAGMLLGPATNPLEKEIAAALLFDKPFRGTVTISGTPGQILREQGFLIDDVDAANLRTRLVTTATTKAADAVFTLMWSGSLCYGSVAMYDKYSHPNR
jgi:hypothetical protein